MPKVLIIEDDRLFRVTLTEMFTHAGYKVITANDGEEGLELFKLTFVDLVITDIIMPVMEGIETIIELRRINPGMKIIAMSAGGQIEPEKYLSTATALKVNAVLKKPFSNEELIKTLDTVMNMKVKE